MSLISKSGTIKMDLGAEDSRTMVSMNHLAMMWKG